MPFQNSVKALSLGPTAQDQNPSALLLRVRARPSGDDAGVCHRPKGIPRGLRRRPERWRFSEGAGSGHLFQPPAVWGAAEGGGGGVRVQPAGRAHDPMRDVGI